MPAHRSDADGAIQQVRNAHPDAVVTEVQFPNKGGWQLIEEIKSDPSARHIPVIVLTAAIDLAIEARAQQAGCAAVLTKPCLPDDLARTLREVLPNGALSA